ncbi:ABC transporter transmembrane domain-containing protein [Paenibacillus rhizoplanae]
MDIFNTLYMSFANSGSPLDIRRMWLVSIILLLFWLAVEYAAYVSLYNKTYKAAYSLSATGRLTLAEHIRHLSLGFFGRRDPADITNLLLSDYGQVEQTISHNVPQLISAVILPLLALAGLVFVDWRMALAMFAAIPLGGIAAMDDRFFAGQIKRQPCRGQKNEAASRLQEYLSGIREIKAHNMGGKRFERLRLSFDQLKGASIRLEGIMGPLIMGGDAADPFRINNHDFFVGSYLLAGGRCHCLSFYYFF